MLVLLRKKGPSTEGVFRKPCNRKNMREIREQLDSGLEVDMEAQPVVLLVGLIKVSLTLESANAKSGKSCSDNSHPCLSLVVEFS